MLLHESPDFPDLLAVVAREQAINPGLAEKNYWIMHALWGLQQLGFSSNLKEAPRYPRLKHDNLAGG